MQMTWEQIKDAIRTDLLTRPIAQPQRRIGELDNLDRTLKKLFPDLGASTDSLRAFGKDALRKRLTDMKGSELNGAEKTLVNAIFKRL
jgi:hypothetical protein